MKHLQHLTSLTLYNNELSNLDENLDFFKDFVYLEHLELFGNPLSEEPNYRNLTIHTLRVLNLFDRHKVTDLERIASDKFFKDNKVLGNRKHRKKVFKVFEQISKCEMQTLNAATKIIQEDKLAQTLAAELEKDKFEKTMIMEKPPLNNALLKLQNIEYSDRSGSITEWEKSKFCKSFKAFDPKKEGFISVEDCLKVFDVMTTDEHNIGKAPELSREEFEKLLNKDYKNDKDKVGWNKFRQAMDDFEWIQFSAEDAEERINALYKEAQSLFFTNKREESLKHVLSALCIDKNLRK